MATVFRCLRENWNLMHAPLLPDGVSISQARRTVERLRSGAAPLADPRYTPEKVALIIERSIARTLMERWCLVELSGTLDLWEELRRQAHNERVKRLVRGFHRMKKSPAAGNPNSYTAKRFRFLHYERRNELGRPPRRRRTEAASVVPQDHHGADEERRA